MLIFPKIANMLNLGNRELKIFSGQKGYVGTEKFRRVRGIDDEEISKSEFISETNLSHCNLPGICSICVLFYSRVRQYAEVGREVMKP